MLAPPATPEQAADAVLAAVKARDDAALRTLAAIDEPDPWLVADELIRRRELDVADSFSRAAPTKDVERLPDYVASQRGKPDDSARRRRVADVNSALAAGKPLEALEAGGTPESVPPEVVSDVRLAFGRGLALLALNRAEDGVHAFLAAADTAERLGWLARASRALSEGGKAARSRSDYPGAFSAWERLYQLDDARGDKAAAARTLGKIGNLRTARGDYAKSLAAHERVLVWMEALGDKGGTARALHNIGYVYQLLGDYAKALAAQERALAVQEARGDKAAVARALLSLGRIHARLGDFAKALAIDERARAAFEALGDEAEVARALGSIGYTYQQLGDYPKALAMLERARAAQVARGNTGGAARTLIGIGLVHSRLGDFEKALAADESARATLESLGDMWGAARALSNLGYAYQLSGDYPKALATQQRTLAAREALGDKAGAAWSLSNIGESHLLLGDHAKAIKFLERAARAAEKLGANVQLVHALGLLARARLQSGDPGRAISEAHLAVTLLKSLVGGLAEEQGATAREQYTTLFTGGLAAAAAAADASEAAFFLESGRAGTLLESLGARDALRWAGLPEKLRLAESMARAGEARALVDYTNAIDGDDRAAIAARREELQAARAKVEEAVGSIQRDAKKEARLWYPVATPCEDIQGFLAPGDALVLYGLAAKDEGAHALVLTREEARIVPLGKSADIVAACEAFDASDLDTAPEAALDRLRALLIKPLSLTKTTRRLLVSPEGPLSYVPFSMLGPEFDVACEPSGTTYGVLVEERSKQGRQVLALADPDYMAKFDATALDLYAPAAAAIADPRRGGRLSPLPGTRQEAMAVADVSLFGKDASEAGLRAALAKRKERWHAVHFACHGLVDPDRPTLSSLVLTPDAGNDGFLTVLEVLRMEIPADLVVLSACETGKGKVYGGEGIVGLTRAFMFAGSPRVICSLWKVDDEATRALMVKFYALWNPKDGSKPMGTAAALKAAQDYVRSQEKWKHPYYWAAWVLWGLPD